MNPVEISNPAVASRLIVVMGVSGCGKSSVASALADHYGFLFLDADDFHSQAARERMASGQPLTDEMRAPWVESIRTYLQQRAAEGKDCILAFSGLRKQHRDRIRTSGLKTVFLFLEGGKTVIGTRLQQRTNHFMNPGLLDSQFDSLEKPLQEADVIVLDISPPLETVVSQAIASLDAVRGWNS